MTHEMALPAGGRPSGQCGYRGGGTHPIIGAASSNVKQSALVLQALANEGLAEALAAWHRERAAAYLRWYDLPWCAAQYTAHVEAAEWQDLLAARHRRIAAALGVHHGI